MLRAITILIAGAALLGVNCADTKSPHLASWQNGEWHDVPVGAYTIDGKRDGAQTHATVAFTLQDGRELRIELSVAYNPTPSLAAGRWQMGDAGGEVVAESIKFLGGQGEGPSLGGRFRLEWKGSPRFRATLPLRRLEQDGR